MGLVQNVSLFKEQTSKETLKKKETLRSLNLDQADVCVAVSSSLDRLAFVAFLAASPPDRHF